jgi:MazG family protein
LVNHPGENKLAVSSRKKVSRLATRKARRTPRKRATTATPGQWFEKLLALQRRLRAENGCPWDREQTHQSLRKYLIEEAYEVLDAMEGGNPREFSSELGDLLLQIIFHSLLAEETGQFTIIDVIESVHTKMVRRHPHVFSSAKAHTSAEVLKQWDQIKAEERAREDAAAADESAESLLRGIPRSLPAVLESRELTRRASRAGFDWDDLGGILDKLEEEKKELLAEVRRGNSRRDKRIEEEVGDLLFVAVNIARFLDIDPEIALKNANLKFRNRFAWMERAAAHEGRKFADLPRPAKETLWDKSKSSSQREAGKASS